MQKVVFFVGVAGTGKTTVAEKTVKHIPAAFLDRDTIGGRFVEAFLNKEGLDPDDRDSGFYKENLRDLEYDTAKDICVENIRVGQNVFMISPFTKELKSNQWMEDLLNKADKTKADVDVKVIVVTLDDIDQQKSRIKGRGTERDSWKLENWTSYENRVNFVPEINWDISDENILIFDNSGDLTDKKVKSVVEFIRR
ncbi:AAA domain-containing protein [Halolactibacillus halophilus]|uniref:AAA domain-containing protein n=1 Tax=Halolactibacillus halophilus TaxID=306540 RepID=A0A1I5M4W1_9BACI|nr:AAA family ATPase [Halolactibacillus halophilus]GEM01001.1 ATPase [Halolactibacillus halophilus]SFP04347.1 AAA domain-containing protein [Halolactibacillus halophilus]